MRSSWKRLWSCFACFGITWGALNVAQAAPPFSSQAIKQSGTTGGKKSQPGITVGVPLPPTNTKPQIQKVREPFGTLNPNNQPPMTKYPSKDKTPTVKQPPFGVLNPNNHPTIKPLPPTTNPPTVKPPIKKPPFGVLNPNNHPPFTPTKPPKISDPLSPFPPVVTNPPVKPPVLPPFNPPLGPIGPVKPPVDPIQPPFNPPLGPIGPVKPPVDPIQPPFNPPLGPIGPIKPPVHPPIDPGVPPVIDPNPPAEPPAQPPAPPADPGNNDPHCPPHCPPFPWPPIFGNCIPGWGGYGGGFGGPIVIQPYPIGGGNVVTIGTTPTVVTVPAPAAEAVVQSIDLELLDLRFVDDGLAADQGPRYRVTIRNLGRTDIASQITVALLASAQAQPNADAQYATTTLESLKAGAMQTVDVRLPVQVAQQPQAFGFLAAAVAMTDGSADANPTNNGATYERAAVRDVDLRLDTVRVEGNKLILVGEGFGRSAGKLTLQIGQAQHAVTTAGWNATEVGFAMPAVDAQNADRGLLQVVRTDGRTAPPLELTFAR